MSSFIVKKRTIDTIVSHLLCTSLPFRFRDEVKQRYRVTNETELGTVLWNLNADAYAFRYREDPSYTPYVFQYCKDSTTAIQAIKSLDCLLYQCSEGDIVERDTFKQMEIDRALLVEKYITKLDEYNLALWG